MAVVLDTWPVMEFMQDGALFEQKVSEVLEGDQATMSSINVGEVYFSIRRRWGAPLAERVLPRLRGVVTAETPSAERVIEAATINSEFPLSYADAFATAKAIAHDAELWTGDPELLVPHAPGAGAICAKRGSAFDEA